MAIPQGDVKKLVGIYAATAVMMAIIIPVPVLAQAFPDTPTSMIQMIPAIPSLVTIVSAIFFSKLAHRFYKRQTMIFGTVLYIAAGVTPYFFHESFAILLAVAAIIGVGLGAIQNGVVSLIADSFDGEFRAMAMGLLSLFVGIGGVTYASLSGILGSTAWYHAYLAYLVIGVLLLLELLFLPKGSLEEKPTATHKVVVPSQVKWLCLFGFFVYAANQLFSSNASMLIAERGLGSAGEAGIATTINTLAGMLSGLLIVPFLRLTKRQAVTATIVIMGIGCVLMLVANSLPVVAAGGFCMALSYGLINPLENQGTSAACEPMGMAFNLALVQAVSSLGTALSPVMMGALATPFGGGVSGTFVVGIAAMAIMAVISAVHYSKEVTSVTQQQNEATV